MTSSDADPSTILIVEDDAEIRETMAVVLEAEGFGVKTASDGKEALDVLRQGAKPGLILLDLMMPGMNGWQFRDEQKRTPEYAKIPVIFVSALDPESPRTSGLDGAGFLRKPFDLASLLAVVERVLPSNSSK
jgi:DNA-binding response OmpR family regulator